MDAVWSWMQHNMGDVPNWVSALGTIAAFFAVVIQLRREQAARHRMEERRREEEHRAQASPVAAWFEGLPARNPLDPMPEPGSPEALQGDRGRLVVSNSSSLPIYEVVVDYDADGPDWAGAAQQLWVELLPPGDWIILPTPAPHGWTARSPCPSSTRPEGTGRAHETSNSARHPNPRCRLWDSTHPT